LIEAELLEVYDESAAREILRLAGEARRRMDFFAREDLVRAASEMDVPEESILQAEVLVRERQSEMDDRAEFMRGKVKEARVAIPVGIVLVAGLIISHSFSFVGHFFSIGKGFIKGFGALWFSGATRHEMEFQEWRNKRYYKALYGSDTAFGCLNWYFKERKKESAAILVEWLVEENGFTPVEAKRAITEYSNSFLGRVEGISALNKIWEL
jgi:hypothetical protein